MSSIELNQILFEYSVKLKLYDYHFDLYMLSNKEIKTKDQAKTWFIENTDLKLSVLQSASGNNHFYIEISYIYEEMRSKYVIEKVHITREIFMELRELKEKLTRVDFNTKVAEYLEVL